MSISVLEKPILWVSSPEKLEFLQLGLVGIKLFSAQFCACVCECMCVCCARACVCACLWRGAHWCMVMYKLENNLGNVKIPSTCYLWRHGLLLVWSSPGWLGYQAIKPHLSLPPQNWDDKHTLSCVLPSSRSGFWGSNSGLHANVTRILSTELTSQPHSVMSEQILDIFWCNGDLRHSRHFVQKEINSEGCSLCVAYSTGYSENVGNATLGRQGVQRQEFLVGGCPMAFPVCHSGWEWRVPGL